MRISDWSSDVCSSDLIVGHDLVARRLVRVGIEPQSQSRQLSAHFARRWLGRTPEVDTIVRVPWHKFLDPRPVLVVARSEEHTSELQSLMRRSYAVFCLKKKKIKCDSKPSDNIQFRNTTKKNI